MLYVWAIVSLQWVEVQIRRVLIINSDINSIDSP